MSTYEAFILAVKDIHRLQALQGHLGWDRETIMPEKGAAARASFCERSRPFAVVAREPLA